MSVPWTAPELAARYSPHVEELRDFFALQHLHCGAPEDLAPVVARLDSSDSFREELTSMVRVILLREGGSVPRADLLEIVTVAIAGADVDDAPLEIQQTVIQPPVQQIFAFLNGVLRMPWNRPPGEERLDPEPVPTGVAILGSDCVQTPELEMLTVSAEKELQVPLSEDYPVESLDEVQPAPTPNFVRPESVYSRFATLVAGMHTLTAQTAAGRPLDMVLESPATSAALISPVLEVPAAAAPSVANEVAPQPEPLPDPVQLIYARNVVPWPRPIAEPVVPPVREPQPGPALEQMPTPAPNIFFPPPMPSAASLQPAEPPSPPPIPSPPSTLDPEPPSPSIFAPIRRPNFNFIRRPQLNFIRRPNFNFIRRPNLDFIRSPHFSLKAAAIRVSASQVRVALISGAAASLFVAALMYSARRHADTVLGATKAVTPSTVKPVSRPEATAVSDNLAPAAAAIPAGNGAAADPIPSPSPSAPRKTHHPHDDGYVAKPYSTPIPPELAVHPPTSHSPSASNQATESAVGTASGRSDQ